MKKRFISVLLISCLIITLLPMMATAAAEMYDLTKEGFSFKIIVKTKNVTYAGTDSLIYGALSSKTKTPVTDSNYDGIYQLYSIENSDGFEKGYTDTCYLKYTDNIMLSPIYFQLAFVPQGWISPDWYCDSIEVVFLKGASPIASSGQITVNKWFDKKGDNFTATITLKRTITSVKDFDKTTLHLTEADHWGTWKATWDGTVTDNIKKESYNSFQYVGAPLINIDRNDPNYEYYWQAVSFDFYSVSIDKYTLYHIMKWRGLHSLSIPVVLTFYDSYTEGQMEWRKYIHVYGVNDVKLDLNYRTFDDNIIVKQTDALEYPDSNQYGYSVQPTVSMFENDENLAVAAVRADEKRPIVSILDHMNNTKTEKTLNIPDDYDFYWGTILGEDNFYYTMVGYDNQSEDPNKTVIKIYKIDTDGLVIGTAEIKGRPSNMGADQNMYASIRTPFKGSAGAMKWVGGKLYIHIGKESFASSGTVHQANISYTVDTSTMTATFGINGQKSYVSHSLNQKLIYDNGKAVTIDHGDGYPRALRLSVFGNTVKTKDIFEFTGDIGQNKTYHKVTGLEQSSSKYLVVGKSFPHKLPIPGYTNYNSDQNKASNPQIVNMYLITVDKETLEYTHKWITTQDPTSNGKIPSEPRLVPVGNDRFILIYGRYTNEGAYTFYHIIEADGTISDPITIEPMLFETPIQPVVVGNSLCWLNIYTNGDDGNYKAQISKLDITKIYNPLPINSAISVSKSGEQYDLPVGETYYFDLSDYVVANTSQLETTLPDRTLHYVPFTYAGTVHAYNLPSQTAGDTNATLNVSPSDRSLFISDYNLYKNLSWNGMYSFQKTGRYGIIFGMEYENNYLLRTPTGGGKTGTIIGYATPATNEWDAIITKNSEYIKNWYDIRSWCHDNSTHAEAWYAVRGGYHLYDYSVGCNSHSIDIVGRTVGYRPVLQVDSSKLTARDSLKTVTLHLTFGNLKGQRMVNIVSAGSTFKAPSAIGLTNPDGNIVNSNSSFSWNTQPDGSGQKYLPGEAVPSSVTMLYANWGMWQRLKKVNISNDKITSIDFASFMRADIIVVFYKDGDVIQIKRQTYTGYEQIGGIDIPANADIIKVMMWESGMRNLRPFGSHIKLVKKNGAWTT